MSRSKHTAFGGASACAAAGLAAAAACAAAAGIASAASAAGAPVVDPMRPYRAPSEPAERRAAPDRYVLTVVLVSAERRVAVVNGRVVQEGDEVDGAKVAHIDLDRVELERGQRRFAVALERQSESSVTGGAARAEPPAGGAPTSPPGAAG